MIALFNNKHHTRCRCLVMSLPARVISPKGGFMKNYELMYIIPSQSTDEEKEALIAQVNGMIEKDGGKIESVERIGNKKLAYEIQKKHEGFYVLVNFTADSKVPNRLGALLSITNNILRYIIVAK